MCSYTKLLFSLFAGAVLFAGDSPIEMFYPKSQIYDVTTESDPSPVKRPVMVDKILVEVEKIVRLEARLQKTASCIVGDGGSYCEIDALKCVGSGDMLYSQGYAKLQTKKESLEPIAVTKKDSFYSSSYAPSCNGDSGFGWNFNDAWIYQQMEAFYGSDVVKVTLDRSSIYCSYPSEGSSMFFVDDPCNIKGLPSGYKKLIGGYVYYESSSYPVYKVEIKQPIRVMKQGGAIINVAIQTFYLSPHNASYPKPAFERDEDGYPIGSPKYIGIDSIPFLWFWNFENYMSWGVNTNKPVSSYYDTCDYAKTPWGEFSRAEGFQFIKQNVTTLTCDLDVVYSSEGLPQYFCKNIGTGNLVCPEGSIQATVGGQQICQKTTTYYTYHCDDGWQINNPGGEGYKASTPPTNNCKKRDAQCPLSGKECIKSSVLFDYDDGYSVALGATVDDYAAKVVKTTYIQPQLGNTCANYAVGCSSTAFAWGVPTSYPVKNLLSSHSPLKVYQNGSYKGEIASWSQVTKVHNQCDGYGIQWSGGSAGCFSGKCNRGTGFSFCWNEECDLVKFETHGGVGCENGCVGYYCRNSDAIQCPSGYNIVTLDNGRKGCAQTTIQCQDGFSETGLSGDRACKITREYTYYEYKCNSNYIPTNNGGDCQPSSTNDLIDTNSDGIGDTCNSSIPPVNNCKKNQYFCSQYNCNIDNKCGYAYCASGVFPASEKYPQNESMNLVKPSKINSTVCTKNICDLVSETRFSYCGGDPVCPKGFGVVEQNGNCYKPECPPNSMLSGDGGCYRME